MQTQETEKIPVGISSCLLGNKVRYDGSHKRSPYCRDELSKIFEFRAFCPEMQAGMGTPRPVIRLISTDQGERVIASQSGEDFTEQLVSASESGLGHIKKLSGYIFTHKSPSCGVFRTRLYDRKGNPVSHKHSGVYARMVMQHHPLLPVEEAERLNDPQLRENFLVRVFAWHRWKKIYSTDMSKKQIMDYYTAYKYTLMAHDQTAYKQAGVLLANNTKMTALELADRFIEIFMHGLGKIATRRSHSNVLQHIQGYLKRKTSSADKQELCNAIEHYREGHIPLIAPIMLLKHHLGKHRDNYLEKQHYLQPYPDNLGLRSRI